MIESAGYKLIKEEGYQEGELNASRDNVVDLLIERFELVPESLITLIHQIDNLFMLKMLFKKAVKTPSLEEFTSDVNRFLAQA